MKIAHLYFLVWAVYHGNKHVEQNHHHGNVVDPVQHIANVLDKFMIIFQHHRRHLRQPKYGPKESFKTLLNPVNTEKREESV